MTKIMIHKQMQRRSFLRLSAAATFAGFGLAVVGCGSQVEPGASLKAVGTEKKVIKDIRISSSGGIPGGILTAAAIVSGKTVTLYCDEGSHKHAYSVDQAGYQKLINGETLTITTQVAQGHTHDMIVDPKINPRNAKSETIEPKSDDLQNEDHSADNQIEEEPKIFAAISEGDESTLYIAGKKQDLDSVTYCVGPKDACLEDLEVAGAWKPMTVNDKLFFKSDDKLILQDNMLINVRAKSRKIGSKVLELFLKVASKS